MPGNSKYDGRGLRKSMGISAFGVEHGEVYKAAEHWTKGSNASAGRLAAGALVPGIHGAVAGKKGKKLKAAGHEFAPAVATGTLGIPLLGGLAGTNAAQNKGYYKGSKAIKLKQKKES